MTLSLNQTLASAGYYACQSYPHTIRQSVSNLFNDSDHLALWLTGGLALSLASIVDQPIAHRIERQPLFSPRVSAIGDLYGQPWGYWMGLGLIWIEGRLNGKTIQRQLDETLLLIESLALTGLATEGLKRLTGRPRPNGAGHDAFPSGHTSGSFALAAVMNELYGSEAGTVAYGMAAFVAATRINDRKHHLSDVVAGAVLGIWVGRSCGRTYQTHFLRPVIELGEFLTLTWSVPL